MNDEQVLRILRESDALLEGHFELRSGLHSNRFFQCANVLRYPGHAEKLAGALAKRMRPALGETSLHGVIAPALGGIVAGHELTRALAADRNEPALVSIFAEKIEDTLALRRFQIMPGERYVVAEDVVTRGGRVQETIDIVTQAGAEAVAVGVLVDRSGGKATFPCPMVSLLAMEPVVWEPSVCPLCRAGKPLVHPGS